MYKSNVPPSQTVCHCRRVRLFDSGQIYMDVDCIIELGQCVFATRISEFKQTAALYAVEILLCISGVLEC